MKTYIQFISENLNSKQLYLYNEIRYFVDWFNDVYREVANSEGWDIFDSDFLSLLAPVALFSQVDVQTAEPSTVYYGKKFWQIQRFDEAILNSDHDADNLAKEIGIILDPYGVVIGFNGINFLENPEKIKESLYINPIMKEHIETWKLKIDTEKYNL